MNQKIKTRKEHDNVYLTAKRVVSLMLALLLLFSITPTAFATNGESQDDSSPTDIDVPIESTPTPTEEETQTEQVAIEAEPPLEEDVSESKGSDDTEASDPNEGIMLASSTTGNLMFFNLSKPDYTVRMGTQVAVTYPENGNGTLRTAYIKNIGWHYASPNKNHTLYCIEPHKNFGESTSYNALDAGVTLTGSATTYGEGVWYSMPLERRQAIALILLYSDERWDHSVDAATTAMGDNPNVFLRCATQFLIYEIVTGLRDPNTFERLASNGYTSGDVFYNAGVNNIWNFAYHYDAIESSIKAHLQIPSFTSKTVASAPAISLTGTATSVTDTNGVLSKFTFSNGNGVTFSKSGNKLTINQTGAVSESTVYSCSRNLFSPEESTYSLWYSPYLSKYQTCISLYGEVTGSMKAYFKLKASTGSLDLTKTTEDGKNLAGWQFSIYSDAACTNRISGPHTTDANGKIAVGSLSPGTVYVKEIGHTDPSINALYKCESNNPQEVTISGGSTATVSFHNKLNIGTLVIQKATNTGNYLEGWKFSVSTDAEGNDPITGSPFTTDSTGKITIPNLIPGTYYVRELFEEDIYWVCDSNTHEVSVIADTTTTETVTNNHYGMAKITKLMPTGGSTAGWGFEVRKAGDNSLIGTYTTGFDGTVTTGLLEPGEYIITEIIPDGSFYKNDSPNPQTITVAAGETVEIAMTNVLMPGEISIKKVNHEGTVLEGVEFLLEWSKDKTSWSPVTFSDSDRVSEGSCTASGLADGKLITDANGCVSFTGLHPQLHYRVTEISTLEGYQLLTEPAFEGTLSLDNNLKVDLQVVNCPEYQLPMTGDNSLMHYAMLATAMMCFAVCTTYFSFKKRKD